MIGAYSFVFFLVSKCYGMAVLQYSPGKPAMAHFQHLEIGFRSVANDAHSGARTDLHTYCSCSVQVIFATAPGLVTRLSTMIPHVQPSTRFRPLPIVACVTSFFVLPTFPPLRAGGGLGNVAARSATQAIILCSASFDAAFLPSPPSPPPVGDVAVTLFVF